MLEMKLVNKTFNVNTINEKKALEDLNLTLENGEFVTVIGGNGSGKSTLLNLVAGTMTPDSGQIMIGDKDVTYVKEHKRAGLLGRVFQDPIKGTAANMWIEENLAMAYRRGKKRGLGWSIKSKERAFYKDSLSKLNLGLENRLTTKVGLLSGGQRQALTLLMATLIKPKLLLLDEHTAALDPKTADVVLQLTNEFVKKDNLTTLMITHNLKDAINFGNRLVMVYAGKIIYDVSGEEKQNLHTKDLLLKFEQADLDYL